MIIFWLSCCYSFIVVHNQYRRSNHKLVIKNRLSDTWNIKKLRICGTFQNGSLSLQRQYEIWISIYHVITWPIISRLNKNHVIRGLKQNWHCNAVYKNYRNSIVQWMKRLFASILDSNKCFIFIETNTIRIITLLMICRYL